MASKGVLGLEESPISKKIVKPRSTGDFSVDFSTDQQHAAFKQAIDLLFHYPHIRVTGRDFLLRIVQHEKMQAEAKAEDKFEVAPVPLARSPSSG